MNSEIKRLLKLSSIPNFKLTKKEETILETWKNMQKPIVVKPAKKVRSKTSKTASEPTLEPETVEAPEVVKNVITSEDKTLNDTES